MSEQLNANATLNSMLGLKPEKGPFETPLIEKVHKALDTPLKDLNAGHVRLLIGQNMALEILMPIALRVLRENPFVEVTFYEGDMLVNCLRVKSDYWAEHLDQWQELNSILDRLDEAMKSIGEARETFKSAPFQP